jgi:predicted P-loop ATPase
LLEKGLRRNDITKQFEVNGRQLLEEDVNKIFVEFNLHHPDIKGLTWLCFEKVLKSSYVPTFNPIKNYLDGLPTIEGDTNIENLVEALSIVEVPELERIGKREFNIDGYTKVVVFDLFKKWLVGTVASVFENNYNPLMFVLVGPKGCGKTEFFRRLLPKELMRYFAQSKFNEGKDSEALMCEALLILNDELDGLHTKDARTFRNIISANYYTYRRPYAAANTTNKRLATVCGTANDRAVVTEGEHNRRIIPVEISEVNHEQYNQVDKSLIIAEAYQAYKNGFDWNLSKNEMDLLALISTEFETVSIELETLQQFFRPDPNFQICMTNAEIKSEIEGRTHHKINPSKLGQALNRLGFQKRSVRKEGHSSPVKCYGVIPLAAGMAAGNWSNVDT